MLTLTAQTRDMSKKASALRHSGFVPAVFYGRKEKSTPISIAEGDFAKVWKKAGESTVVLLKGDFGEHETLITDIDAHPVTGVPRHADFYVLEKGQKVKVHVPLEFIGVSPAIKDLGGTLVKVMREIEVEAAPKDLPQKIEVSIVPLAELTSQILVKNLTVPTGVVIMAAPDEVVASVAEFKEEGEEVVAPVNVAEIELSETKGKIPKEGEEAVSADGAKAPTADATKAKTDAPKAKQEKK